MSSPAAPVTEPASTASSSDSTAASTSSGSLRPPGAKSLMPLSAKRLCEAEIMAPGTPSASEMKATPGVGRTPRRCTATPSAAKPAARAASRRGPEMRVSRPTTTRSPPSTRAAARPRARESSGVSSVLATPRMPSVPNRSVIDARSAPLALRVLGRLAGLLQAVLLALLHPRVAGQEPGLLQVGAGLRIELHEGAGDAHAQGTGLAGHATTVDRGVDVVDLFGAGEPQRLGDHH